MQTFLILFQGGLGGLAQLLPIVLIIAVFYVLLIRPQQKRQKQLQETIASLKIGDRVVTTGGIIGVITRCGIRVSLFAAPISRFLR
jgi:preprotein translocase YajC subunit